MISSVTNEDPEGHEMRRNMPLETSLDDMLWVQAMNSYRYLEQVWRRQSAPDNEFVLFHMLHRGLVDTPQRDRAFPMATRSMRYTAIVGERLWALIERERQRVGRRICCTFDIQLTLIPFRLTDWKGTCTKRGRTCRRLKRLSTGRTKESRKTSRHFEPWLKNRVE
jgi:hypothetical protein